MKKEEEARRRLSVEVNEKLRLIFKVDLGGGGQAASFENIIKYSFYFLL